MKRAKALVLTLVLMLAVFCFFAPAVVGGDEHPWDEEGGDDANQGGGGLEDLPEDGGGLVLQSAPGDDGPPVDPNNPDGSWGSFMTSLPYFGWYYYLPGVGSISDDSAVKQGENQTVNADIVK